MEMVALTCGNPQCVQPQWERPAQRGRVPLLCPTCKDVKEEVSEKPQFQQLVCSGEGCPQPNWQRPRSQGKLPTLCPTCREKRDLAKEEEKNTRIVPEKPQFQDLICSGEECPMPNWQRPWAPGKMPTLCPTCREAKIAALEAEKVAERTEREAQIQKLTCQNLECEKPRWSRPWKRGNTPKYCPTCRAEDEEEEETVQEEVNVVDDPVVFTCLGEETAERILAALRSKYKKTTFYFEPDGEELAIRLKRPVASIRISTEVFDRVQAVAQEAAEPPIAPAVTSEEQV